MPTETWRAALLPEDTNLQQAIRCLDVSGLQIAIIRQQRSAPGFGGHGGSVRLAVGLVAADHLQSPAGTRSKLWNDFLTMPSSGWSSNTRTIFSLAPP